MTALCPFMERLYFQPGGTSIFGKIMKPDYPDETLAREIQKGNTSRFSLLVDRYGSLMLNYLFRLTASREDAEDMVQELFVRVYQKIHTYKPEKPFKPWLYRVATNLCYDFLKKRKSHVSLDKHVSDTNFSILDTVRDTDVSPEESIINSETVEHLQNAVAGLPEKHRETFVLFHFENFSYRDIASMLNIPEGTVKSRLHNASREIFLGMQNTSIPKDKHRKPAKRRRS